MAEKQEKSSTNIKERSDGFIHTLNSLYVLTVVSLLMDMSVRIVNTQKKDEDKTYT